MAASHRWTLRVKASLLNWEAKRTDEAGLSTVQAGAAARVGVAIRARTRAKMGGFMRFEPLGRGPFSPTRRLLGGRSGAGRRRHAARSRHRPGRKSVRAPPGTPGAPDASGQTA